MPGGVFVRFRKLFCSSFLYFISVLSFYRVIYNRFDDRKKDTFMPEENREPEDIPQDHPWIEMPVDDNSPDETLRFSLDEIRIL